MDADGDGTYEAWTEPVLYLQSTKAGPAIPYPKPGWLSAIVVQGSGVPTSAVFSLPDAGGPLWDWVIVDMPSWASPDASTGQAPTDITLSFADIGLPPGVYSDTCFVQLTIQDYDVTYPVVLTMEVVPPPVPLAVDIGRHQQAEAAEFILPIRLEQLLGSEIYAAHVELGYDPDILTVTEANTAGTVAEAWGDPFFQITDGAIKIDMTGAEALADSGIFLNILFDVVGTDGDSCRLTSLAFTLNDGIPPAVVEDGWFIVDNTTEVRPLVRIVPKQFALHQNYPNPFNPTTTIQYDIPKESIVIIRIYDLVGQEIDILVNAHRDAGRYTIDWNAEQYPSGIYLYRLEVGEYTATRKLVLQK